MIALDTNVLVRYLTQDDPVQARQVRALLESVEAAGESAYIGAVCLCEVVWVLDSAYDYSRAEIARALEGVLATALFEVEAEERLWIALADYREKRGDFADYVIGRTAAAAGCTRTMTLDRTLVGDPLFEVVRLPANARRGRRDRGT
ncbi:MAG: PIN domain-containing protein [Longimicrobiales bacterium]